MANGKLKKKLGMTKRPTAAGQEKFGDVDVNGGAIYEPPDFSNVGTEPGKYLTGKDAIPGLAASLQYNPGDPEFEALTEKQKRALSEKARSSPSVQRMIKENKKWDDRFRKRGFNVEESDPGSSRR